MVLASVLVVENLRSLEANCLSMRFVPISLSHRDLQ